MILFNKRKELMNELYDSVDYNNLTLEYKGLTKNVSFYDYMDYMDYMETKQYKTWQKGSQTKGSD